MDTIPTQRRKTLRLYEQKIIVTDTKTQERLVIRRVRLVLFEPTRDGETEIVLLMLIAQI